jgi:hypothetical protein
MRPRIPLFLAFLALVTVSCGGGGDDESEAKTETSTTVTTEPPLEFELERGEAVVASAGGDVALDDKVQQAVVDASQKYIELAVLGPIVNGKIGKGYGNLFDAAVKGAATGADRAALTDEDIPKATETPTVTAAPVRVDAIADATGQVLLLATTFDVDVRAETKNGEMSVIRNNELTFAPGPNGKWLITAYRVSAERDLPKAKTTTSTAAEG